MADFKLTYFPGRGRAECFRIAMELAGQKYDEVNFKTEEWADLKKKLTDEGVLAFGQVPVVEYKGKNIVQSLTLLRLVGRLFNLYGDNDDEKWQMDMIIDGTEDLRGKYYHVTHATSGKDELEKEFNETILPVWIGYFENLKNKNAGDFFVGKRVSIADVAVFSILSEVDVISKGLVKKNATLKAFMESFEKQPKYAEYRKSSRYHN